VTIAINVPGGPALRLAHAVLDLNGTLAMDGELVDGVEARLVALRDRLAIHLVSADTYGNAGALADRLGLVFTAVEQPDEAGAKRAYVRALGAATVAAIGNGANDAGMLAEAAVGIAVVAAEGASCDAVRSADVLVTRPADALDLLLRPARLTGTLRR
jgi:P-type E1-E2 ATPase